jgi:glycerol kinase
MVLGLDLGSSLVHAALVDPVGRLVRESVRKIHRAHPGPGLVEHDLRDLWKQCISVIREALSVSEYQARRRVGKFQDTIEAMGISTQRNTLAVWDRDSGEPLFPAISWSDSRTADLLKRLSSTDAQGSFRKITHRDLSTTNLGLKLRWLLEANPQLEGDLRSGKVCWGTLDFGGFPAVRFG